MRIAATCLLVFAAGCESEPRWIPVADAGADRRVVVGDTVALSGAASRSTPGDNLRFDWRVAATPAGADGLLNPGERDSDVLLETDLPGLYTLRLVVEDARGVRSAPDVVNVLAEQPNRAPQATLTLEGTPTLGGLVQLDGSGSSDPDGDPLTYRYATVVSPRGATATPSPVPRQPQRADFRADRPGFYVLGLEVYDGQIWSTRADLEFVVGVDGGNTAPVADCSAPLRVRPGQQVPLDARASTDAEGDPLTFAWSLLQRPQASAAALLNATSPTASFTADVEGEYQVQLLVDDGQLWSAPCLATVVADTDLDNTSPVAEAGPDQQVDLGEPGTMDGRSSSDPDGDPLLFAWTLDAAPADSALTSADITGANSDRPVLIGDVPGSYTLTLEVCDWEPLCDADVAVLEVSRTSTNTAPVADAGADRAGDLGVALTLDGSGSSDPDGDPLSFSWSFSAVPGASGQTDATLRDRQTAQVGFTPDVHGTYELLLTVDDGQAVDQDLVVVTVAAGNSAPLADAGPDQSVAPGDLVVLDGSNSSDPDGDPLAHRWAFVTTPAASSLGNGDLADRMTPLASFTPDAQGTYELRVAADDGVDIGRDYMLVHAASATNQAPVADAGPDQSAGVSDVVTLDGTGSTDPDGDPLTHRWALLSKPGASTLGNADITDRLAAVARFTPDVVGIYELRVAADDGAAVGRDVMQLSVSANSNRAPLAAAGSDQQLCGQRVVQLDAGASSDPDGDPLTFAWSFTARPSGSALVDGDIVLSGAQASFSPDVTGQYTLQLTASDGLLSGLDSVDLQVDALDAALVLHLDEGAGVGAADSGPHSLTAALLNGDWLGGRFFSALDTGAGELLTIPDDPALDLVSGWTIEWWMRSEVNAAASELVWMKGTTYSYAMWRSGSQDLYFYGQTTNGSYAYLLATTSAGDGAWHHYAVTLDSSLALVIYEDGVALASGASPAPLVPNNEAFNAGGFPGYPGYYDLQGALDELVVHDVALSAAEVATRAASQQQLCSGAEDTTAPTGLVVFPANNSTVDQPYVAVEGTSSDDSAVAGVRVNGVAAVGVDEGMGRWTAYVPLVTGSNTLVVEVEDIAGNLTSNADSVTVNYTDTCFGEEALALRFDEDLGGVATDDAALGLHATETGVDRVVGQFGNAALFDGVSSLGLVPHDSSLDFSGDFSVELWFSRDGAPSGYELMLSKGASASNYLVGLDQADVGCAVLDSTGTTRTVYASGFTDGDLHHLACVHSGASLRLLVDGVLQDQLTTSGQLSTNTEDLMMGSMLGASYFFDGRLDGVAVWPRALSDSEAAGRAAAGEPCEVSGNLAPSGVATASGSASAARGPGKVIDQDTAEFTTSDRSYWLLPRGTTGAVTVELAQLTGVTQLRWLNTHHGPQYNRATQAYRLELSATGAFMGEEVSVDAGTAALETDLRFHQIDLSTPVPTRYLRFSVDSYHGAGGGLNELEVQGL